MACSMNQTPCHHHLMRQSGKWDAIFSTKRHLARDRQRYIAWKRELNVVGDLFELFVDSADFDKASADEVGELRSFCGSITLDQVLESAPQGPDAACFNLEQTSDCHHPKNTGTTFHGPRPL